MHERSSIFPNPPRLLRRKQEEKVHLTMLLPSCNVMSYEFVVVVREDTYWSEERNSFGS
jgi:hypothetical protein